MELDPTITNDSTVANHDHVSIQQMQINTSTPKYISKSSVPENYEYIIPKKQKFVYDTIDLNSVVLLIRDSIGKFIIFENQPEVYLTKVVEVFKSNEVGLNFLDNLVNHFSKMIDLELHDWYWENIFQQPISFEEF